MSKKALSTAAMESCEMALATPLAKDTVPAAKCRMPLPRLPISSAGSCNPSSPTLCIHAPSFPPKPRSVLQRRGQGGGQVGYLADERRRQ